MARIGAFFNEHEAQTLLNEINKVMAGIFCKPIREVRFVFLSYIASGIRRAEVLGQCVRGIERDEIQLIVRSGWQNTAIHELVHVYNPDATESQIKKMANDVIKYLKLRYTQEKA